MSGLPSQARVVIIGGGTSTDPNGTGDLRYFNYEIKNEEGMAHFLEHMIFKGSKSLKEGEFDLKIESLGGSSNAATGLDDVHYYVLVPPENTEEALNLLLELLLFPKIEQDAFEMDFCYC